MVIEKTLLFGVNERVVNFYTNNHFETVWKDSVNRNDLISAIIDSQYDGVLPENYPLQKLINGHWNYNRLNLSQLKKIDIAYTETYFKIANQLALGKVNPKKLYGDWEPYLQKVDYDSVLKKSISEKHLYQSLEQIKPTNHLYAQYKKAFAKYVPVTSTDTLSAENLLRKKIWVNFERTKWIQPNLGDYYVWVNLPEYRLKVIANNEVVATHKVIVGKKNAEHRFYHLFSVQLSLIQNGPFRQLYLKRCSSKGYCQPRIFLANRLTIFHKKTGKIVDPYNWNPENYSSYRYVQQTGPLNSLGQIKFDFPNKHMVYLHDTNNKSRFAEHNRALSSGCIRVENPFSLAEMIFGFENNEIQRSEIDTLVVKEKTKSFKLNKKVNVHQVYFTAVINESGKIQILNDVYSLDNVLYKKLIQ